MLHTYGEYLSTHEDDSPTIISHPRQSIASSPRQPLFLLADVTQPASRQLWWAAIYQMRQTWPHMPIGLITEHNYEYEARAYSAGANLIYHNITPLEQVYSELAAYIVPNPLTARKAQIVMAYSIGRAQQQAANELFIVAETVKSHTKDLYEMLEVSSKPMLMHKVFSDHILPSADPVEDPAIFPLTPAETTAILAIGVSESQAAAAEMLDRSELTIKTHCHNIRRRLGWTVAQSLSNVWRYGQQWQYQNLPQLVG